MLKDKIELEIGRAVAERAREGDRRGKTSVEAITNVVKRHWFQLVDIIRQGGERSAVQQQAAKIVHQMTAATEAAIEPLLLASANWGFDSAFDIWESHLPAAWWKIAFQDEPEIVLLESVEFNFPEPGGPGPRPKSKGKFTKQKTALDKVLGSKRKFKPSTRPKDKVSPKTAAKVKAKAKPKPTGMLKIVRSRGWKGRMRKWTKKITDFDNVARIIADGVERKLKFETIVNRVKPFVQNYAASARRLVRTESARIENEMMEQTYKEFAGIIDGYQIINPLDERTRPEHGIRAGRIYWNDKRKKPHASDRPSLPDAPNCRCCYAPVLNSPAPEELLKGPRVDTRTYAGYFNNLSDKEKAKVVGGKRWAAMKDKNKRPSWFDAIDPKTGRFIGADDLKSEQPRSTLSRRKKNRARMSKDISAARKSLKYWPPDKS